MSRSLADLPYARVQTDGGVLLELHVIPGAARTEACGLHDGALRLRLQAPPVDGRANEALRSWLAGTLGIARDGIELLRGASSRRKVLRIAPAAAARADWSALRPEV